MVVPLVDCTLLPRGGGLSGRYHRPAARKIRWCSALPFGGSLRITSRPRAASRRLSQRPPRCARSDIHQTAQHRQGRDFPENERVLEAVAGLRDQMRCGLASIAGSSGGAVGVRADGLPGAGGRRPPGPAAAESGSERGPLVLVPHALGPRGRRPVPADIRVIDDSRRHVVRHGGLQHLRAGPRGGGARGHPELQLGSGWWGPPPQSMPATTPRSPGPGCPSTG